MASANAGTSVMKLALMLAHIGPAAVMTATNNALRGLRTRVARS